MFFCFFLSFILLQLMHFLDGTHAVWSSNSGDSLKVSVYTVFSCGVNLFTSCACVTCVWFVHLLKMCTLTIPRHDFINSFSDSTEQHTCSDVHSYFMSVYVYIP